MARPARLAHEYLQTDADNTVSELRVFFSHASARICFFVIAMPTLTQKVMRLLS